MNTVEFNKKYFQYLEEGFYGLDIVNQEVIEMLDQEFSMEIEKNPNFKYAQVKLKFGTARVYADTLVPETCSRWEEKIDAIVTNLGKKDC